MKALGVMGALGSAILAIAAGALFGIAIVATAVHWHLYGQALFVGLPVGMSALTAFVLRLLRKVPLWLNMLVSLLAILVLGVIIIASALDGAVCLILALPLAVGLAVPGALLGHALARCLTGAARSMFPIVLVFALPAFLGIERFHPAEPVMRTVTSRVTIDAPIGQVWDEVIAFDRITNPPTGIFRLGVAYPIQARIFGHGVGAVRHCIFSTGPFVEPITVWQPPRLLEFDVAENPPPMNEMSPYGHIDVPHLHGTFVSRHGRFRLWEENGRVVLEGTTWYYQQLAPDFYWHCISDAIIHQIHLRVLEQIQRQSENRKGA